MQLPVALICGPQWTKAGILLVAAAAYMLLALLVFGAGLRRYQRGWNSERMAATGQGRANPLPDDL